MRKKGLPKIILKEKMTLKKKNIKDKSYNLTFKKKNLPYMLKITELELINVWTQEGGDICVIIADLHHCTAENTTL